LSKKGTQSELAQSDRDLDADNSQLFPKKKREKYGGLI
jgi:hypothetical protein